ncbi:YcaO-like family protein [Luteibacter aegosomaticola]|uniref:YcaO-like family protein n=1 Tax=Luteibacter aegosomaticola TaxID=2911538 RepID=UPI001FFBF9C9|nr:YcaO-like family protein [Luteibacter aegosomaticola]UPG88635.1 YcaO-like family protein [Luteibacter aegosomaticola]
MIPFERDVPIADAMARVADTIHRHGLHAVSATFGDALCTVEVELRRADGTTVATGHGKGNPTTARVGAMFEALEHYLSLFHPEAFRCTPIPVDAVCEGLGEGIDALLRAQAGRAVGCRMYRHLIDGTAAYIPLALAQPRYVRQAHPRDTFDYHGLERYASNSGTAIGSTDAEASLHAINECIERDDVSRWLHAHFHTLSDAPLRLVARATCDAAMEYAWRAAEAALDDDIILVDVGRHAGTTSRMAFSAHWPHDVHLYGAGSSMCPAHASERALAELVQQAIRSKGTPLMDAYAQQVVARVEAWPRLARACRADLPLRLRDAAVIQVGAGERLAWQAPAVMLQQTTAALAAEGYAPMACMIPTGGEVSLCSVIIPGFSRYYLVGNGIPVAPH